MPARPSVSDHITSPFRSRKMNSQAGCASLFQLARTFNGYATFAESKYGHRQFCVAIDDDDAARAHQVAMVTAALAHDQPLRSSYATCSALCRDGLIEHEIRSHLERLSNCGPPIHQRKRDAAFVGFSLAQLFQHHGSSRNVVAVHDEGVVLVPV